MAAAISEQLASDTAVAIPYETRLGYILTQIRAVNALENQTRSLLIFQKFNDGICLSQEQTPSLLRNRALIYLEQASVYRKLNSMQKLAFALFQAADSLQKCGENDAGLFEEALVAAFAC